MVKNETTCPKCESDDVNRYGILFITNGVISMQYMCGNCGRCFDEIYRLSRVIA